MLAKVYVMMGEQEHAMERLVDTLPHWPKFRNEKDGKESEIIAYRSLGLAYMAPGEYDLAGAELRKAAGLSQMLMWRHMLC